MESAWHRPGFFCLVVAVCLAICIGCAAPSDEAANTSAAAAETPPMVIFTATPETGAADAAPEVQAPSTDMEAAALTPSPDPGTPAMIFFTATADQTELIGSPGGAGTPSFGPEIGTGAPGSLPAGAENSPAAEFTRVALDLTPAVTAIPRPSRAVVSPSGTAGPQDAVPSDAEPTKSWPRGWGLAAGTVVAIILFAWFFAKRRS
jgi:hypothetical protein